MLFILLGVMSFLFFLIYDINSVVLKKQLLNLSFLIGFLLLVTATAGIVITDRKSIPSGNLRIVVCGAGAAVFLALLLYTLFFALPFIDTYTKTTTESKVCRHGMYALCRHPGVLWFIGFYTFLGLAVDIPIFMTAAILFCLLNLFYVAFQDRWTFIKTFKDYNNYKIETPFLIPNKISLKRCMETFSRKEVQDEI